MNRRDFIGGLGSAGAWPLAVRAQQEERVRRIGTLQTLGSENDQVQQAYLKFNLDALANFGWIEGRNLRNDVRFGAGEAERIRALAAELVSLNPEAIITGGVPATRAVQQQTQSIPIVFVSVGDPVASGIVKNIAHPEGNITGITNLFPSIAGKWVELLKEMAPRIQRIGLLYNAQFSFSGYFHSIDEAAHALMIPVIKIPYRDAIDIVQSIDAFAAEPDGGLIIVPPSPAVAYREIVLHLAARHRLPTICPDRGYVAEGGLMSYGSSNVDLARRVAYYVDRILRGAKVSELPVEFPGRFELIINLRTAQAIGLTIPESFLLRADEVIE
jgi:putative tryptophan/tyrosine transport system substrate-binding protein